jgi:hypothetical protein
LVVRKKNAMDNEKGMYQIGKKKYTILARRNAVHHIEMIKYFEWGKRNVSIWGENYVTGGRRNP